MQKQTTLGPLPIENKKKKNLNVKETLSKLSRGIMLPVALMPIAGMMIGIGSAFTSQFEYGSPGYVIGDILSYPGAIVFACLPFLFAIAIAITFTKDAGVAGLCAMLSWIIFVAFQHALIIPVTDGSGATIANKFLWYYYDMNDTYQKDLFNSLFRTDGNIGIQALSTNVFGGIVIGATVAFLYNRFKHVQLPNWIGFFSGVRFVPVVAFPATLILALIFAMIWPLIGTGFFYMGAYMSTTPGAVNVFLLQLTSHAVQPFGLHFVINSLTSYTAIGGTFDLTKQAVVYIDGNYYNIVYSGISGSWKDLFFGSYSGTVLDGQTLINNQMLKYLIGKHVDLQPIDGGNLTNTWLSCDMIFKGQAYNYGGQLQFIPCFFSGGNVAVCMFALPAIGLAMLNCVPKGDERKKAGSIIIPAVLTAFFCGVGEPLWFTFLFVAPWLYWGVYSVLNSFVMMIAAWIMLYTPYGPYVYGSCVIDLLCYSLIPEITSHGGVHTWSALALGVAVCPIYYFIFTWCINRFNLATPGRNGNEVRLFTKKDVQAVKTQSVEQRVAKAQKIIQGLGGQDNILDVGACFTRLRCEVKDNKKVNEKVLKETGAIGFMYPSKESVHVVYGPAVDAIKTMVVDQLKD